MKKIIKSINLLIAFMLFAGFASQAQKTTKNNHLKTSNSSKMKTYVIEREIPDAGKLTADQLKAISKTSCGVLKEIGPKIQWMQSYVTGNKIYCVYKAENEDLVKEHAKKRWLPC